MRSKTATSSKFSVGSGVRQGNLFSPAMFLVIFFIINQRILSVGCNVSGCHIGCLIYADDLILLPAAMNGLQAMLSYACNLTVQSPHVRP